MRLLSRQKGVPGKQLLQSAGTNNSDDSHAMSDAIEAACECVDENEW